MRRDKIVVLLKPVPERASAATVAGTAFLVSAAVAAGELFVPLRKCFGTVLIATSRLSSDGILNAGILEWVFRTIPARGRSVFDWTAGFPLPNTLAGGENLFGWQLLYFPLRTLGAGIDFSYNLLLLSSLVVSCVGAALLARRFGASAAGALASGIVFAFVPFHLGHLRHLQTMAAAGLPFVFLCLDRYIEKGRAADAAAFGAAGVLTSLCSSYFGVFLLLMVPAYVGLEMLAGRRPGAARLAGLALTAAICGALLLPLALHYFEFAGAFGFRHRRSTLDRFSLAISSLTRFPEWERFWSGTPLARGSELSAGFPGATATLLAALAFFLPAVSPEARRRRWLLAAAGATSLLFALGPDLQVRAGHALSLPAWFPLPGKLFLLVQAVRWPVRIYFFTILFAGVLAGLGLTDLLRNRMPRWRKPIELAFLACLLLEYRPRPGFLLEASSPVPPPLRMSDAYPFLASDDRPGGVVELPAADPTGYRTPALVRSVFASAGHGRRVVAFFGAVALPPADNLLAAAQSLPLPAARRYLAANGVNRLVVHRAQMPGDAGARFCEALRRAGYRALFDGSESTVFDLDD